MPRYRVLIWLDAVGGPTESALALYEDGEPVWERVLLHGPFDTPQEVLSHWLQGVDEQLRLL